MTNPCNGSEPYQTAWQQGNDYGKQNPGDGQPQAPDFSGWGYDDETAGYIAQVWQEGVLAGREAVPGGGAGDAGGGADDGGGGADDGGGGGVSDLPHYDTETDTLYVNADEFPALDFLVQCGDVDTWLTEIGIDPSVFSDDEPVA